jgi:hypothetical protein
MTATQPTSQSHIIPITRFHDVLDAGERVLLFGDGQRNTKPTILLHPAISFRLLWWLYWLFYVFCRQLGSIQNIPLRFAVGRWPFLRVRFLFTLSIACPELNVAGMH